jgi:hypothetical protein
VCVQEIGYDYDGSDLDDPQMLNMTVSSTESCGEACLLNVQCSHFTYISLRCYLKTSNKGRRILSGAVSGACTGQITSTTTTISTTTTRTTLTTTTSA